MAWDDYYWCNVGCNRYHSRRIQRSDHLAMVPWPEPEEPDMQEWPGTELELRQYIVAKRLLRRDAVEQRAEMQSRIDAILAAQEVAINGQ